MRNAGILSRDDFGPSAAKGAEQARQQQEASRRETQKRHEELALWAEKANPIQNAIELLSRIEGIDISYENNSYPSRGTLSLKNGYKKYDLSFSRGRYEMQICRWGGPPAPIERKTLKNLLGSIAMMTGKAYPDKAPEIDRVINEVIAAQPHKTLPQRLKALVPGK